MRDNKLLIGGDANLIRSWFIRFDNFDKKKKRGGKRLIGNSDETVQFPAGGGDDASLHRPG